MKLMLRALSKKGLPKKVNPQIFQIDPSKTCYSAIAIPSVFSSLLINLKSAELAFDLLGVGHNSLCDM